MTLFGTFYEKKAYLTLLISFSNSKYLSEQPPTRYPSTLSIFSSSSIHLLFTLPPYKTQGITLDRWYGVPVTLEANVTRLHQEIFNQSDYVVSNTVKQISDSIVAKTGYTE